MFRDRTLFRQAFMFVRDESKVETQVRTIMIMLRQVQRQGETTKGHTDIPKGICLGTSAVSESIS